MMKIFLDAGHNATGYDTGASGNGLKEQDITYQIARKVADRLKSQALEVKMSRSSIQSSIGTTIPESINGRVKMANDWGADLFISIHCNASANHSAKGTETLVYSNKGKAYHLAQIVNSNLVSLGLVDRGVKVRTDLGVLKNANMPAILIEVAFISNASDAQFLRDRQDDIATAIVSAVLGKAMYGGEEVPMIYNYIDENMPEWAHEAVKWAVDNQIVMGTGEGLGLDDKDLKYIVWLYRAYKLK